VAKRRERLEDQKRRDEPERRERCSRHQEGHDLRRQRLSGDPAGADGQQEAVQERDRPRRLDDETDERPDDQQYLCRRKEQTRPVQFHRRSNCDCVRRDVFDAACDIVVRIFKYIKHGAVWFSTGRQSGRTRAG